MSDGGPGYLEKDAAGEPNGLARGLGRYIKIQTRSRKPTEAEKKLAVEMLGNPVTADGVADFLWAVTMLPEFQLIN